MTDKELLKILVEKRPVTCIECGGKLTYDGLGEYKCMECGNVQLDDFGKVRRFLVENGPRPAPVVVSATGVPGHLVTELLKGGRIETIGNSKVFINCQNCGCAIRYGRICPDCAQNVAQKIALEMVVGEKAHKEEPGKVHNTMKMRYFGSNKK